MLAGLHRAYRHRRSPWQFERVNEKSPRGGPGGLHLGAPRARRRQYSEMRSGLQALYVCRAAPDQPDSVRSTDLYSATKSHLLLL